MIVPSIAELERAFGSRAVSIAEVGLGRFLSLDRWPEGEVRLTKASAGRSVTLWVNPAAGLLSVDLETLDPAVRIEMSEVTELRIESDPAAPTSISLTAIAPSGSARLLLHPDIRLHVEMPGSALTPERT